MGLFAFLIVGLIAGFIAEKVLKADHGLLVNLLVGVIGAYVGGFLAGLIGLSVAGVLGEIVIATVGAIVFLYVLRIIRRR